MEKADGRKLDQIIAMLGDVVDVFGKRFDRLDHRFDELDTRLGAVESKVDGINQRLDTEAMQRTDLKIPRRVHDLEEEVFGTGASKHPKHQPH